MRIRIHSPACNIQYAKRPSKKCSGIALRFCRTTFNGTVFFYLFIYGQQVSYHILFPPLSVWQGVEGGRGSAVSPLLLASCPPAGQMTDIRGRIYHECGPAAAAGDPTRHHQ